MPLTPRPELSVQHSGSRTKFSQTSIPGESCHPLPAAPGQRHELHLPCCAPQTGTAARRGSAGPELPASWLGWWRCSQRLGGPLWLGAAAGQMPAVHQAECWSLLKAGLSDWGRWWQAKSLHCRHDPSGKLTHGSSGWNRSLQSTHGFCCCCELAWLQSISETWSPAAAAVQRALQAGIDAQKSLGQGLGDLRQGLKWLHVGPDQGPTTQQPVANKLKWTGGRAGNAWQHCVGKAQLAG